MLRPEAPSRAQIRSVALYMVALLAVLFALFKAETCLRIAGKSNMIATLSSSQTQEQIANADKKPDEAFNQMLGTLIKHGRFREVSELVGKRLSEPRFNSTSPVPDKNIAEKAYLLKAMADCAMRQRDFKNARLYLEEARSLAEAKHDLAQEFDIADSFMALAAQGHKFSRSKEGRLFYAALFDKSLARANEISTMSSLDPARKRRLKNHAKIALLEFGRLLEVENYDPEPSKEFSR